MSFKNISFKIASVVLIVFILVFGSFSLINYSLSKKQTTTWANELLIKALDAAVAVVKKDMDDNFKQLNMLVEDSKKNKDYRARIAEFVNILRIKNYASLYEGRSDGSFWAADEIKPAAYEELSYPPPRANYEPRERPWYKDAKRAGKITVGAAYLGQGGATDGQVLMTMSAPLYFDNGSLKSVIAIDFPVTSFKENFKSIYSKRLPSMGVVILDKNYKTFSHKDQKYILLKEEQIWEKHLKRLVNQGQTKGKIVLKDEKGEKYEAFYELLPRLGWVVAPKAHQDNYISAIKEQALTSTLIAVSLLALSVIIIFFIITKMLAPINIIKDNLIALFAF